MAAPTRTPTYRSRIFDRFSNENIYKTDARYKMKADLRFEAQVDEDNMSRDKMFRSGTFLRWSFLFSILKILSYLTFSSFFEIFFSLVLILCLGSAYYLSTVRLNKNYL